jgi:GntR family phosphonate transport system transcriptional regulator
MELVRRSGVALWRQIAEILEEGIRRGEPGPGVKLPTEHELAARFGVNRHTARQALSTLEESGLIRAEQGSGWFVKENVISYQVARQTRFSDNLSRQSRIPGREILSWREMPAAGAVAQALGLAEGEPVLRMDTTGMADGRCINVSTRYFPKRRFPMVVETYRELGSISKAMAQFGVRDYHRRRTVITARMPTVEEAHILGQSRNRPVLVSESINADDQGRAVEYGVTRFASDWVQISINAEGF